MDKTHFQKIGLKAMDNAEPWKELAQSPTELPNSKETEVNRDCGNIHCRDFWEKSIKSAIEAMRRPLRAGGEWKTKEKKGRWGREEKEERRRGKREVVTIHSFTSMTSITGFLWITHLFILFTLYLFIKSKNCPFFSLSLCIVPTTLPPFYPQIHSSRKESTVFLRTYSKSPSSSSNIWPDYMSLLIRRSISMSFGIFLMIPAAWPSWNFDFQFLVG